MDGERSTACLNVTLTSVLRLSNRLNYLINPEKDDIRFYPLNETDVKKLFCWARLA